MSSSLHVLFRVGQSDYVVPATAVVQMDSYAGATPVPGSPPYVSGIAQLRGRVVPVVDLRARFGLPPIERGIEARIIVVSVGERHVGLLADSAREVVMIDEAAFQEPPAVVVDQAQGFVNGIAEVGKRIVMRLRFDAVVTPDVAIAASSPTATAPLPPSVSGATS